MTETLLLESSRIEPSRIEPVSVRTASEPGFASALRAGQCAQRVAEGYLKFDSSFRALTDRAADRFAERDWQGIQQDALDRIELYERIVDCTVADIRTFFSDLLYQPSLWQAVKRNFASLINDLPDSDFSKEFFNATIQRLFRIIGVPQNLEFAKADDTQDVHGSAVLRRLTHRIPLQATLVQLLDTLPVEAPWQDVDASAAQISAIVEQRLQQLKLQPDAIEWLDCLFYRFTRGYAIGRIHTHGASLPFALALTNTDDGVIVDALMLQEAQLASLFGCTRASFHVELDQVAHTVSYLQELAPTLTRNELIATLGWPVKVRAVA